MFRPLRLLPAVPIVAALLVLPAAPASADGPVADLDCIIIITSTINPSLSTESQTLSSTSHGLTGTADCTGTIDGAEVTDTGAVELTSVVVGSCAGLDGSGTFVLQIETTEGVKTVAGRFDIFSGPVPGEVDVTGDLDGTVSLVSADGDCVNTPISTGTSRLDVHVST